MSTSRFAIVVAVLALVFLITDRRARADDERTAVEGAITLDGKPLPAARVFFHQKDGQFMGAKTNDEGKFRVKGVPTGTYKVTIELYKAGKSLLPRLSKDYEYLISVRETMIVVAMIHLMARRNIKT
jgi:hypothetical protein